METTFASPNGIFKQLDLAEKETDGMQEGNHLGPQPTTPVVTTGHESMEMTPTGQSYQPDDEMYDGGEGGEEGKGGVQPHDHLDLEATTNGIAGDGSETPKGKRIPPPMSAEKAAYLAGVTRGADYEFAHDTVARAAVAAAGGAPPPAAGRGAPMDRGGEPGRGRFAEQRGPRGPDLRGPALERPTHFTQRGGAPGAGRGAPRPDMGRGMDMQGPVNMYNPNTGGGNIPPSLVAYYTRGQDYEEAHDVVARAATAAADKRPAAADPRPVPAPEYQPAPAKQWQQGQSGAPWQEAPKPAPQWTEPVKPYQQGPPAYQPQQPQYQQAPPTYTQPAGGYGEQPRPVAAATQGAARAGQGGYGEQPAYQAPQATFDQGPSQQQQAPAGYDYSTSQYTQPSYGSQQAYTAPTQQGFTQDYAPPAYSQAPQGYAQQAQDYNAQAPAAAPSYQAAPGGAPSYQQPAQGQYQGY